MNAKELPSGQIIDHSDDIFISNIKMINNTYQFNITWASRVCETLKYDNIDMCLKDRNYIKNFIIPITPSNPVMICD